MRSVLLTLSLVGATGLLFLGCNESPAPAPTVQRPAPPQATGVAPAARLDQSKPLAQEFMTTLMGELSNALAAGGPAGAVDVCARVSTEVEEAFSDRHPDLLSVRRVSLRTRNPETHTPTLPERQWLTVSETIAAAGHEIAPEILTTTTTTTVLFPISIQKPLCLLCHGPADNFPPDLQAALDRHYPADTATGYELGDLRGALAFKWER